MPCAQKLQKIFGITSINKKNVKRVVNVFVAIMDVKLQSSNKSPGKKRKKQLKL